MRKHYSLSTTEHHGPITHPNSLNSVLLTAIPFLTDTEREKPGNVIVLSCANISFDNPRFPRGHLFTGEKNITNQLVLFSRNARPCPVVYFPPYDKESITSALLRNDSWLKEGSVNEGVHELVSKVLKNIYSKSKAFKFDNFSDQVSYTNFLLWQEIFSNKNQKNAPDLIYIEQEKIVIKLLKDYHLNKKTIVNSFLFDPNYHILIEKYFNNIQGAFSLKEKYGSFLFWALPKGKKYRIQLWRKEGRLVSEDGLYQVRLTPKAIRKAIENKELIPSTLLSFVMLAFYYGLNLRGGFDQTNYLTQMKDAFILMNKKLKNTLEIENMLDVPTDGLSLIRPILAFLESKEGIKIPATGLDFYLYSNENTLKIITEIAKKVTFEEAIYRALPSLYRAYCPQEYQQEELLAITEEEIDELTGLKNKVTSFAKLG